MLEIIAQILCALLAFAGIHFIVQGALHMKNTHAAAFVASLLAGVFALVAAGYFYGVVEDQASGARKALHSIQQELDYAPEAVMPD